MPVGLTACGCCCLLFLPFCACSPFLPHAQTQILCRQAPRRTHALLGQAPSQAVAQCRPQATVPAAW
jgi:hypothetical protein